MRSARDRAYYDLRAGEERQKADEALDDLDRWNHMRRAKEYDRLSTDGYFGSIATQRPERQIDP